MFNRLTGLSVVIILMMSLPAESAFRMRGAIGVRSYGYEDSNEESHNWIIQNTRLSVYKTGTPWSVHFSGGYIGDNADDFSESGQGRFLKGYLKYGDLKTRFNIRAGRFFLYKGVAVGVIDGLDASYAYNPYLTFNVFGGMLGPYKRNFESEEPGTSSSIGGEVQLKMKKCAIASVGKFAVSYVQQEREAGVTRHLVGLNTYNRWGKNLSLLNTLHLRPTGNTLRKFIGRLRYRNFSWNGVIELGLLKPDVTEYSWFNTFGTGTKMRVRTVLERYFAEGKWGCGLEGAILSSEGNNGFRGGPTVVVPWGKAGYRFSGGDHAISSSPWVSLRYNDIENLELYTYGAIVTYEWDAFDIETDDLVMAHAGFRYFPGFLQSISLNCEYQVYQTPELNSDRRVIGGVTWRFDTSMGQ